MRQFNCPNCGGELQSRFQFSKLIVCEYCDSSVTLNDDAVELLGKQAAVTPLPSILTLHEPIDLNGTQYTPIGRLQYSYANGTGLWEEWWAICSADEGTWISVDEGEIAIQRETDITLKKRPQALRLGDTPIKGHKACKVTEMNVATLVGLQGELPKSSMVGDEYNYWHLESASGELFTIEQASDGERTMIFQGEWLDPYELSGIQLGQF